MLCAAPRGGGRYAAVDERALFERLWRGAFCQALGNRGPVPGTPLRFPGNRRAPQLAQGPQCCCHCHCLRVISDVRDTATVVVQKPHAKTMRSVVR